MAPTPMRAGSPANGWLPWAGIAAVVGLLAWALWPGDLPPDETGPSTVLGAPVWLDNAAGPTVFVLTEHTVRRWHWGRGSTSRLGVAASTPEAHVQLWAFDAVAGGETWNGHKSAREIYFEVYLSNI